MMIVEKKTDVTRQLAGIDQRINVKLVCADNYA